MIAHQREVDNLTNPVEYAHIGALAGISLVGILMTLRFDTRQRNPLGVSFFVVSLVGLLAMAMVGYRFGQFIERSGQADDGRMTKRFTELPSILEDLSEQLTPEKTTLEALRISLSQISKFDSQIVSTIDEMRGI